MIYWNYQPSTGKLSVRARTRSRKPASRAEEIDQTIIGYTQTISFWVYKTNKEGYLKVGACRIFKILQAYFNCSYYALFFTLFISLGPNS